MKRILSLVLLLATCCLASADPRLVKASRAERGGWLLVHLEGTPSEIGFQHGWLLAPEIDDAMKMMAGLLKGNTAKDWTFFRQAAQRMFLPRLGEEYRAEIDGIVEGLRAKGYRYDATDVAILNGWTELAWYYAPWLTAQEKGAPVPNKAPGNCSAFIATGGMTKDGRIVMGHNSWVDYAVGIRWRVAWDILPAKGYRLAMDGFPGTIHSGDDFVINGAGLLITETTITGFKSFDPEGTPEFVRARRAAQYSASIDDFVRIMSEASNGAYANTWLIGDLKTNEIAKLDLGLKHQRLWRTRDGAFVGSNFATDEQVLKEETTFDASNPRTSPTARRARWDQLMTELRGKLDLETGKQVLADHVDAQSKTAHLNRCGLCGHLDRDPEGAPEWDVAPFYPQGATSAKVTTAELAKRFEFWGRIGHPCGETFDAASFLEQHPEFRWQSSFLLDMKPQPWTLLKPMR